MKGKKMGDGSRSALTGSLALASVLLTGCSGEPYPGVVHGAYAILWLVAVIVVWVLARRNADYQRIVRSQEAHIQKLNRDQLALLEERNRARESGSKVTPDRPLTADRIGYGVAQAMAKKKIEAYHKWMADVAQEIEEMIPDVREGDPR